MGAEKLRTLTLGVLSYPSTIACGTIMVKKSATANDHCPVASLTHFAVKLVFAAPLSFLS
jgi:hypothetical protein